MYAFLEDGSLEMFEKWLDVMPDNTYPNNTIVKRLLELLDKFDVHAEHMKDN